MIIPTSLPKPKASGIDPYHARRRRRNPSLKRNTTAKAEDNKKDNDSWDVKVQSPQQKQVRSMSSIDSHGDITHQVERGRRPKQALGLDTRLLVVKATNDEDEAEYEKEKAENLYQTLLQGMISTGVLPCMIVSTAVAEEDEGKGSSCKKKSNNIKIVLEREVLHTVQQLSEMKIQPIIFSLQNLQNSDQPSGDIPKHLLAKSTWKIIRGLVDTICQDKQQDDDDIPQPMDVTLVVCASSLVGDRAAHVEGLEATVEHFRTYFDNSKIQSIRLVLTGEDSAILDSNHSGDGIMRGPTILAALEKALEQKLGAVSAAGTTIGASTGLPLDINIQAMSDNLSGYQKLLRHFMLQSMEPDLRSARISIDLPETTEGMQCQLLLDASYNILATSLQNKSIWDQLTTDLQALSGVESPLQVLQMVPYSAFDASLLFGVPLRLSASSQASDWHDYHTMKILFGSLLRILQERELVLLLRVPDNATTCGVWLGRPGQCLALMARETLGPASLTSPQTALLWGYSTECQLLKDDGDLSDPLQPTLDDETTSQLQSYVDASLDSLVCAPYNPLLGHKDDFWVTKGTEGDTESQDEDTMVVETDENLEEEP